MKTVLPSRQPLVTAILAVVSSYLRLGLFWVLPGSHHSSPGPSHSDWLGVMCLPVLCKLSSGCSSLPVGPCYALYICSSVVSQGLCRVLCRALTLLLLPFQYSVLWILTASAFLNLSRLLNSVRLLYQGCPSLGSVVQEVYRHSTIRLTSHVSFLSDTTVLYSMVSSIWKLLFHAFWPVTWFLMMGGRNRSQFITAEAYTHCRFWNIPVKLQTWCHG